MSYIGKRSLRSLLALACVVLAGVAIPKPAAAAAFGCGYAEACAYGCEGTASGFCRSAGCTEYSCQQSYSCGLFMVKIVCSAGPGPT